jgi:hypothetical protein
VQEAEFEVELFDKTIIKGKLDKQGRAKIEGVPPEIARIRFGPDVRPFERTDKSPNEAFRETMSEAEIDAMVEERMKRP